MGLYDRDYARQRGFRWNFLAGWSMTATLILLNVVVWAIDQLPVQLLDADMFGRPNARAAWLLPWFELKAESLYKPWEWYRFVTYSFTHDVRGVAHVLFNMFGLYLFGSELENVYGRREILRLYLLFAVVSGMAWCIYQNYVGQLPSSCVGASGSVMGIAVLAACLFPWRTLLFNFFIPVPFCIAVSLYVLMDVMGIASPEARAADKVAHSAHLAGAFCGYLYFYFGWNLTRSGDRLWNALFQRRPPSVRLHRPEEDDEAKPERLDRSDLDAEVDRILKKMKDQGEESLTRGERSTLEEASRRYRDRLR